MSSIGLTPILHPGRIICEDKRTGIPAWLLDARKEWRLGT